MAGASVFPDARVSDQASALVQLGLLDPARLPVAGADTARKVLDPSSVPSNLLMKRTVADELL